MAQVAKDLTDCVDGFLRGKKFLIRDRVALFTKKFKSLVEDSGVKMIHGQRTSCCVWCTSS